MGSGAIGDAALAPFYLAVFRAGFQGSLRVDAVGMSSLVASLEEAVGARTQQRFLAPPETRPKRFFLSPVPLAAFGVLVWLVAGVATWMSLSGDSLDESRRMADRIVADLPVTGRANPLERSIGPSGLSFEDAQRDED